MKTLYTSLQLLIACAAMAQDPTTLSEAIIAARSNRPAFEAARLRVAQANLSRRALGAFPTTRLFVGYSSDREVGGSDDDLVLSQPLDIFGRTSAARNSGNALVAQAEAGLRLIAAEIQGEVVAAYIQAATSAELAKSSALLQETIEQLHEATRLRVEGGVAPGVQLTRVGLELDQAKLRTQLRQAELQANKMRLATLIGTDEKSLAISGIPNIPDEEVLAPQRADLLLLAADVQTAEADVRVARLSGMPELEVQGRRTPWQQSDQRYGVRLQLAIPLFDYGRVRSETRAASVRAEAARQVLKDATRLAAGEMAAARVEVQSAKEQVASYESLVVTARQLVQRLKPALTEQATTLIEVIDATRTLRDVEEALVEARQRLATSQARYLRATGRILEVTR